MEHLTDFEKNAFDYILALRSAVPTEVDLGNPRSPDCCNFGICRINFWNGKAFNLMPSCCPNRAHGYLRRWEEHGIELIFPKENMSASTFEKHFESGWFLVMDAYELSMDMAERLGIAGFTFEPGRYPVLESYSRLHVVFA